MWEQEKIKSQLTLGLVFMLTKVLIYTYTNPANSVK